jgi:NADH dehydrogenase (ubiquinone) Fe-S protein 2
MNRSIFIFQKNKNKNIKNLFLNFGPQHPAAHGVLRMMLKINSEYITKTDIHIGLLHRGTEKLMENKMYIHSLPYFDRFDYVSMMVQEHAYCLSIEKLLKKNFFKKNFNLTRTLFDELTRILNHLLAIACHALDIGSMSPIFWGFEEREKILEFYERVSGARMHAAFYRPGKTFINSLPLLLLEDINYFCSNCITSINEINFILVNNKIWKRRLINIGQFN